MRMALVGFLVAGACFSSYTLAHAATIPVFGTGIDASGHLATSESPDSHYVLTVNPEGGNGPYVTNTAAYPFINPSHPNTIWVSNTATSQWISPQPSYAGDLSDASGQYIYETTFDLSGLNPATAILNGEFAVDAVLTNVMINGVSTGVTGNSQTSLTSFTISTGFVPGLNVLDFLVTNNVQANGNTTGIQVQLSGTASAVPEPASLATVSAGVLLVLRRSRCSRNHLRQA